MNRRKNLEFKVSTFFIIICYYLKNFDLKPNKKYLYYLKQNDIQEEEIFLNNPKISKINLNKYLIKKNFVIIVIIYNNNLDFHGPFKFSVPE